MVENNNQLFAPGMAFVPEAPALLKASSSFGPKKKKSEKDRKVKKNLTDVRRSIQSLLRPRYQFTKKNMMRDRERKKERRM